MMAPICQHRDICPLAAGGQKARSCIRVSSMRSPLPARNALAANCSHNSADWLSSRISLHRGNTTCASACALWFRQSPSDKWPSSEESPIDRRRGGARRSTNQIEKWLRRPRTTYRAGDRSQRFSFLAGRLRALRLLVKPASPWRSILLPRCRARNPDILARGRRGALA
jgi:hypothetical protein